MCPSRSTGFISIEGAGRRGSEGQVGERVRSPLWRCQFAARACVHRTRHSAARFSPSQDAEDRLRCPGLRPRDAENSVDGGWLRPQDAENPVRGGFLRPRDAENPPGSRFLRPQDAENPLRHGSLRPQDAENPLDGGWLRPRDAENPLRHGFLRPRTQNPAFVPLRCVLGTQIPSQPTAARELSPGSAAGS